MACECYSLSYDGKRLRFLSPEQTELDALQKAFGKLCDVSRGKIRLDDVIPGGYTPYAVLGDEGLFVCRVYRAVSGTGGLFFIEDSDGPLLGVLAARNLDFVLGLSRFARAVTYARYASDIFESLHEEDED